ncbi:signal transduction histidine kinase [Brevibacterium sanguinis]|uniref:Oxygen sensor histidine kinase NreB n=2 Tax=Brevibacterium TaxID=1696 RepID=A0A366IN40_9MICO|nr:MULTISPECIES: sensor histidine kinase [Brevibacterium]RBP66108.1 signal transduction histidine kinase [Brevibacterium sanguinis]RBP72759.1 signal transduction histidine kinase [Brevibacterium celere]
MPALLAPVRRLDVWLFVVLVVLLATSSLRYIVRHGLSPVGVLILLGAAALLACSALRPILPEEPAWPRAWALTLALLVASLTVAAPSFAWCAVPVAFSVLRTLSFTWATVCVSALMIVVTASWLRISTHPDPTLVVGPLGVALVTIMSFRALDRESKARSELIDRLVAAQDELAAEQRRAGALRERTRLSRDIHDSIGQDLSSIHLLLQAAERSWDARPDIARSNVSTAIDAARTGLEEIRTVIHDLSTEVQSADLVDVDELRRRLGDLLERRHGTAEVRLRIDGAPVMLPTRVAAALIASTRGALANVEEHAAASRVMITLTFTSAEVRLDIRDDGRGFDPRVLAAGSASATPRRGLGLRGIRERAEELDGGVEVDSEPGDGTMVSVWLPITGTTPTAVPAVDEAEEIGTANE